MSTKPKITTGSLFGALFKRAALKIEVSDDAPPEIKELVNQVKESIRETLPLEERSTVELIDEKVSES